MDSWLFDVLTKVAPTCSKLVLSIHDKIKDLKDEEAYRVIMFLMFAQLIEQNNCIMEQNTTMHRKLDSANEALAVLLTRTKKE
jgi:hypothetical protein